VSTRIVFDIETGSLPWEQIAKFYDAPPALPPFDPSMVKYGNTKDIQKRAEKFASVKADHDRQLAEESATREAHRLEWAGKAALSALTGYIVAIGFKSEKGSQIVSCEIGGKYDEDETIKKFWGVYERAVKAKRKMVGFNSHGFDLKFLQQRSFILGIPIPSGVMERGKYWNDEVFVDVMRVWAAGSGEMISLDTLSRAMGAPGKPEGDDACTGAAFSRMYLSGNPEQRAKAENYLMSDLDNTWCIAEKMGL
jgi:hypothetical protein